MKKGLNRALEIIKEEFEFAKTVNPQMAFGMLRAIELLEKETKKVKINE